MPDPVIDPLVHGACACFTLRRSARQLAQFYDRHLSVAGLKNTQFSLLATLDAAGEQAMTELARVLVMDRTTLSRNLRVLERRGLVQVRPGEDARVRLVRITAGGRKALTRALPHWQKAQDHIIETLGAARWPAVRAELDELADAARVDED